MLRFFTVSIFLFSSVAKAQFVLPMVIDLKKIKTLTVELPNPNRSKASSNFSSIVIDEWRTDTSTIGYVRLGIEPNKYFRIEIENGTRSIERYLQKYFQPTDPARPVKLIIQLKNFLLAQDYKTPSTGVNLVNDIHVSNAFVSARLLIEKNQQLFDLGKLDTIVSINKWLGNNYKSLTEKSLQAIVEKADEIFFVNTTLDQIDTTTLGTKHLSFQATEWKDGIYKSYSDYLNKIATPTPIEFDKLKRVRVVRTVNFDEGDVFRNCWGFVDARVLYVRNQDHFVPMQLAHGSITGVGLRNYEDYKLPLSLVDIFDIAANGLINKNSVYKFFTINPETGELQ